jgi:hypothetical protein
MAGVGSNCGFDASISVSDTVVGAGVGFPIGVRQDIPVQASVTEAISYNESFMLEAYPRVASASFTIEKRVWYSLRWTEAGSGIAWQALPHEVDLVLWILSAED